MVRVFSLTINFVSSAKLEPRLSISYFTLLKGRKRLLFKARLHCHLRKIGKVSFGDLGEPDQAAHLDRAIARNFSRRINVENSSGFRADPRRKDSC